MKTEEKTIQAPKFKVGDEVLLPDGKISKIIDTMFNSASGWTYKVLSKFVDVVKVEVVDGFVIMKEEELELVVREEE